MTKKTTNLLGILITILAGTYFTLMYCASCISDGHDGYVTPAASEPTRSLHSGMHLPGAAIILTGRLLKGENTPIGDDSAHTLTNQP